jgi:hypothetical protein
MLFILSFAFAVTCHKGEQPANVIFVNQNAPGPTHDGRSWATAYLSVKDCLAATPDSGEVWVAAGVYTGCLTMQLRFGLYLYGGFAGTETRREQRNWSVNQTVLDGNQEGTVVTVSSLMSRACIDGFTIRNGLDTAVTGCGGGIHCHLDDIGYLTVANNLITDNMACAGAGIYLEECNSKILNNVITRNRTHGSSLPIGGGIYCYLFAGSILNNLITENSSWNGAGIYTSLQGGMIANNVISQNQGHGIFVDREESTPSIINNTITFNSEAGIFTVWANMAYITNNIVAFDTVGIDGFDGVLPPQLHCNCVYGNVDSDYVSVSPGNGDISLDPTLSGYHLQAGSPCINRGDNSAIPQGWTDIDGEPRTGAGQVDIGADEYYSSK